MSALQKFTIRAIPLTLTSLILLSSQPLRAQSGNTAQFLFAVQTGTVTTYSVDQTTGALAIPTGISPAPIRTTPPIAITNQGAIVNPAGTFLFVAGINSSNDSAVSVLSISATGALAELAASPFSAADAQFPGALAISPDGQFLYELSGVNLVNPGDNNSILDVFSIASDGTLTPVGNYTLPIATTILYMHPTGQWLYAYGDASPGVPTIQQFTIGPPGMLTLTGSLALPDESQAEGLVGDAAGEYVFSLRNQEPGGSNLVDTLSVDGKSGGLTLSNTYLPALLIPPGAILNANEAIDSTGGFLYTSFANFSLSNGIPTLLQLNTASIDGAALLLASRTSPFLFSTGQVGEDPTIDFYSSAVIGSDGTLTPAPGSPYTGTAYYALAVTGSVPVPTEPVLTLSTTSISFPVTAAGQSATATVMLSSTGFSTLLFNSISVSGDASYSQTNNCPSSLAAGSMCTVTVKFAPTVPGTSTGALNIASNAPSASVSLSGTAPSSPEPDLSPATLTFPSTVVGVPSATQPFTIENLPGATAPLQVTGITIGGSNPNDFSQTNNCTAALSSGQSCTITITFTPLAAGGRSATLAATTNAPDGGATLGGTMSGVGAAAAQQFQLQTSVAGPGTIQQTPSGTSFNANTSITLTAVPAANATFTSWSGECAGSTNTVCTFSITANTTVTATFAANPTVSVTQSQQSGAAGATFTFPISVSGFATQPTLTASCSIPAGACTISGTNLIVTTTARSSGIAFGDFPSIPTALTLSMGFLLLFASSRHRKLARRLALVGGLAVLAACQTSGGAGSGGTTPASGTPAGNYTVTIHATAGTQTSTTTITIVVQ